MRKRIVLLTCGLALVFSLALTGCCRVEMESLQDELDRTRAERNDLRATKGNVSDLQEELNRVRAERNDLRAKLEDAMRAPKQSEVQVVGLEGSLSEFQKQIDTFVSFREELQKREDELARLRKQALAEAKIAQERMDKLGTQLQSETERVVLLQNQLKKAQTAIVDLKDKLEK
jgi:chromosome segregation ATPase